LEGPSFKAAFDGWQQFNQRVMDYLVDSGGLSRQAADAILELNQSYIPLKRVLDQVTFTSTGGRRLANLSSPVKRIKGSGRSIQDPIRATIENVAAMISFADKTRVGKALVDLSNRQGAGKWIERLPAPIEAKRFSLTDMEKALTDAGVDLSKADMNQVLTVYSNAGLYRGRDNIVSFYRNGKREFYEVDPVLYRTLKAMDDVTLPPMVDFFLGRPARTIRLGATGLNARFGLITNPIRDAFTFALQSEYASGAPSLIAKGLARRFARGDNMRQLWQRSGADMSQFLGLDRKSMRHAVGEVLASTAERKALNVISHPIEALREVFSFTEAAPRLAEFEAAYRRGESLWGKESPQALIMGNLASSDVTVNFRRAGSYGKVINQMIPFWNAAVQGTSKFYRFTKEHPLKAGIRGIGYLTIPSVLLWDLNKDKDWYRDAQPWQRYGFYNFEVGVNADGSPRVVRLPKPFDWNAFATAPEMVLDYWYNRDPAVITDGLGYMIEQMIPVGLDRLPPLVSIPYQVHSNYDQFRDAPIDPYWETKYKSPEERYSAWTSESAKWLGRQVGVSPRKIDFVISQSTGGLGSDIIAATEKTTGVDRQQRDIPANMPIVGRLFARTNTPEDRHKKMEYERAEVRNQVKTLIREGKPREAKIAIGRWNRKNPDYLLESFEALDFAEKQAEFRRQKQAAKTGDNR
jgi:hypothetical protein